jgi:hypothetical protein
MQKNSTSCTLKQLNRYKSSEGNEKIPPRKIPMIEIVRKVPSNTNTISHKYHHHGGAVCPSYGVGSMDLPDPTHTTSL